MATNSTIYRLQIKKSDLPQFKRKFPTYVSSVSRKNVTFLTKDEMQEKPKNNSFSISSLGKVLGFILLFLILSSIARRISTGSMPTFTSFLAFLSNFDLPTIPFNVTGLNVIDFLAYIFGNCINGLRYVISIIRFVFIG